MRCSSCQSVFSILWAIRGCSSPFPPTWVEVRVLLAHGLLVRRLQGNHEYCCFKQYFTGFSFWRKQMIEMNNYFITDNTACCLLLYSRVFYWRMKYKITKLLYLLYNNNIEEYITFLCFCGEGPIWQSKTLKNLVELCTFRNFRESFAPSSVLPLTFRHQVMDDVSPPSVVDWLL